jgi:hypothetical protein
MDLTAHVPQNIIDLLSTFLPNRRAEVGQLRQALEKDDWARLQHLAERMYALGNPYGFRQITTLGRFMREACANKDRRAFQALIRDYEIYLSEVTIVEVEAPLPREVLTPNAREALLAMLAAPNEGRGRGRRKSGGGGSRTTRKERQT